MDDIKQVPFIVFESSQARSERTIKRLIRAIILAVILLFLSNGIWIYAWCQYDYYSTETEKTTDIQVDSRDGVANYIGDDGDIINGKDTR